MGFSQPGKGILAVYLCLLFIGIPWYWPEENTLVLFGLPAWVLIAVSVSFVASVFTAFILIRYPWPGEDGEA